MEEYQTLYLQQLWDRARAWADNQGLEHNYSNIQGVAPL
jgi:hypothetical protein